MRTVVSGLHYLFLFVPNFAKSDRLLLIIVIIVITPYYFSTFSL